MNIKPLIEKHEAEIQRKLDQVHQITERTIGENGRAFTQQEQEEVRELQTQVESIRNSIKLLKEVYGEGAAQPRTRSGDAVGRGETANNPQENDETRAANHRREYRNVYSLYLRHGVQALDTTERNVLQSGYTPGGDSRLERALSSQLGVQGGYLVPTEFVGEIEKNMRLFSAVMNAGVRQLNTSTGSDIPWPTVNDVDNEGAIVAENSSVGDAADPSFGLFTLRSHTYSSRVIRLPNQVIQDAVISIEELIAELMGERLGRIINRHLTVGDGASKPFGVVTRAGAGASAASATGIASDDFINLEESLEPAYAVNASYMISRGAFRLARLLKDSSGRPLWMPAATSTFANGAPGTINNRPYWVNTHMAAPASGVRSTLFGDFRKYIYRTVGGMSMIRMGERYADQNQTGYVAFMRADGNMKHEGTRPIVALTH